LFTPRVVRHCNRLPRDTMGVPSMEAFKARLHGAMGSLMWWMANLPKWRVWSSMVFKVPSNPSHSIIQ